MSNSSAKINLEEYINSFSWDKRIVLLITKDIHFINETDDFFKTNSCENEERNLKYIRIVGDDINKYIDGICDFIKNHRRIIEGYNKFRESTYQFL